MNLILQAIGAFSDNAYPGTSALVGFILAFMAIFVVLAIAVYIYTSLAFMAIAKKTGAEPAGIAWIPLIGPALIASKSAKMHWWPILLLIGFWIPILNFVLMITFIVFFFIWRWKTFEAVGRPGWWVLLTLIPIAGGIIYLILLGVAAWSNPQQQRTQMRDQPSRPARRKSK